MFNLRDLFLIYFSFEMGNRTSMYMCLGSLVCGLLISIIYLMNFCNFNGVCKVEHDVKYFTYTLGARIQVIQKRLSFANLKL